MNEAVIGIAQAIDFAAQVHTHQRRKGELEEPYVNHLTEVARLLAEATYGEDPNLVIAGLLHDSMEDQEVQYQELVQRFGEDVASLVSEVTDDKSLDKAERKRLQVVKTPYKSDRAKTLKMADKIANLRSILNSPPSHWDLERKQTYFDWAKAVVDGCRGVNATLEQQFDALYQQKPTV